LISTTMTTDLQCLNSWSSSPDRSSGVMMKFFLRKYPPSVTRLTVMADRVRRRKLWNNVHTHDRINRIVDDYWCVASIECMKSDPNMYQSSYNYEENYRKTPIKTVVIIKPTPVRSDEVTACVHGVVLPCLLQSLCTRRLPPYVLSIPVDPSAWFFVWLRGLFW
jgi:hypothetical protein